MVTVPPVIDRPPPSCKTEGDVRELSSNGVMEEDSGKVQKPSTDRALQERKKYDRKGQRKFIQRGDGRRFRESLEGECSRSSAQTRYTIKKVRESASNGVMEECSRKVQKVSTHESSFIVMYLAVVEIHHSAAALNVKASALGLVALSSVCCEAKAIETRRDDMSAVRMQQRSFGVRQFDVNCHERLVAWCYAESSLTNCHPETGVEHL